MTPNESAAEVARLAGAAGAVIGKGWELESGSLTPEKDGNPGLGQCVLPDGKGGTNYSLTWSGPGVSEPDKAIAEIDKAWQKLGVHATATPSNMSPEPYPAGNARVLADPPFLSGSAPDGYYIKLILGTKYCRLSVDTHCIPKPVYDSDVSDSSEVIHDSRTQGDTAVISDRMENAVSNPQANPGKPEDDDDVQFRSHETGILWCSTSCLTSASGRTDDYGRR